MRRRGGSIKLMMLFGVRIGVDPSWFLILFLMIFWLSGDFRAQLDSSDLTAYVTAVVTALALFASLIVHELGHALIARREGIEVTGIELLLFGGVTAMSRDAATPGEDFRIAAAGPAATLALAVACLAANVAVIGPHRLWQTARLAAGMPVSPPMLVLVWLLVWNVGLLAFNLIPAFPLDGGRIARSLVWRLTASKGRGTRLAAGLGQGLALAIGAGGVWLMASAGVLSGLWLVAVAFMVGQAARGAALHGAVSERLETVRVADVMDADPVAIPATTASGDAREWYFARYGEEWFPVIDERGHFIGIVRRAGLLGGRSVEHSVEHDAVLQVDPSEPITAVLRAQGPDGVGAAVAVDCDGVLRGVLTAERLRRGVTEALSQG